MSSNPQEYSDGSVSGSSSADTDVKEPGELLDVGEGDATNVSIVLPQEKQLHPEQNSAVITSVSSKLHERPPLPQIDGDDQVNLSSSIDKLSVGDSITETQGTNADPNIGTSNNKSKSSSNMPTSTDTTNQATNSSAALVDHFDSSLTEFSAPDFTEGEPKQRGTAPEADNTQLLLGEPGHSSLTEFSDPDFQEQPKESQPVEKDESAEPNGLGETSASGDGSSTEFSDPDFAQQQQTRPQSTPEEPPGSESTTNPNLISRPHSDESYADFSEPDFMEQPPKQSLSTPQATDKPISAVETEKRSSPSENKTVSDERDSSATSSERGTDRRPLHEIEGDNDETGNSSLPMEDIVQEALRIDSDNKAPSDSMKEEACEACGFEAALVSEGMIKCQKDGRTVSYCNEDCMKWDLGPGARRDVHQRRLGRSSSRRSLGTFNDSTASGFVSVGSASMAVGEVFAAPSSYTNSGSSSTLNSDSFRDPTLAANLWQSERNTPISAQPIVLVPRKDKNPNGQSQQSRLSQFFEQQQPHIQNNQHPYHPHPVVPVVAITRAAPLDQQQLSRDSDHDTGESSSLSASFDSQHSKPRMVASADGTALLRSQHSNSSNENDEDDLFVSMDKEEKMNDAASFAEEDEEAQKETQNEQLMPPGHQLLQNRVPEAAGVGAPLVAAAAESTIDAAAKKALDEDEESLDIMEPQEGEDEDSLLQSIIEEASEISGDEPDKEGSWRSRDMLYEKQKSDSASLLGGTPSHPRPDPSANDESSGNVYEVVDVVEYTANSTEDDNTEVIYMTPSEFSNHKRKRAAKHSAVKTEQAQSAYPTLPAHIAASAAAGAHGSPRSGRADSSVASNDFGSVLEDGDDQSESSHHFEDDKGGDSDDDSEENKGRRAQNDPANRKDSDSESSNTGSEDSEDNQESFAIDTGHDTHILSTTEASEGVDSFADADDVVAPKSSWITRQSAASHDTIKSLSSHFDTDSDKSEGRQSPGLRSENSKRSLLDLPSVQNVDSDEDDDEDEDVGDENNKTIENQPSTEDEADDDSIQDLRDQIISRQGRRRSSNGNNGSSGKLSAFSTSFNESGDLLELDDAESVMSNSYANKMALRDFRQAYACEDSITSSNSRGLKNFHQLYHSDANSTVGGDATVGSRSHTSGSGSASSKNGLNRSIGDLHEDLEELNSRNSKASYNTEDGSHQSGRQSNHSKQSSVSKNSKQSFQSAGNISSATAPNGSSLQLNPANAESEGSGMHRRSSLSRSEALKMSINKALLDYEKLYGEEAAGAAFQQLAKAVLTSEADADLPATPTESVATAPIPRSSEIAPPPMVDDSSKNGEDNESNSNRPRESKPSRRNSLEGIASMKAAQTAPASRGIRRNKSNTSFSSWALPTDYSVFSIPAMTPNQSISSSPEPKSGSSQAQPATQATSNGPAQVDRSPNISERMSQLRKSAEKMKANSGQMSSLNRKDDYRQMAMPGAGDDSSEEDIIEGLINSGHADRAGPLGEKTNSLFREQAVPASAPIVALHTADSGPDPSDEHGRENEEENAAQTSSQSQIDAGTLSLTTSSGDVDSGPRYLKYRSLLSKGAEAIASAARMLNFTSSAEEDLPVGGGSGSTSPETSGSPTSHSEDDLELPRGAIDGDSAAARQDFRLGVSLSSASSTDSQDNNPRYLRYRSLLALNLTPDRRGGGELGIAKEAKPLLSGTDYPGNSPDLVPNISLTGAGSPETPRYLQYRTTLAHKINIATGEHKADRGTPSGKMDSDAMEVADLESKLSSLEAQLSSYLMKGGQNPNRENDKTLDERLQDYIANDGPTETEYQYEPVETRSKNTKTKQSRRDSWIGMGMDFSSSADSNSMSSDSSPAPRLPAHLTRAAKARVKTKIAEGTASPYLQFVSSQDSEYSQSPKHGQDDLLIDVERGESLPERPMTPSEKKLAKKFYNNRRCMWCSLLIVPLICIPLVIGFAIIFRDDDNNKISTQGSVVTPAPTTSPIASPTTAPLTPAPVTGSPVGGVPMTSVPTGAPFSSSPVTGSPVEEVPTASPPVAAPSSSPPTNSPTDASSTPSSAPTATPSSEPTMVPTYSTAPSTNPTMSQDFSDLELLNLLSGASADGGAALLTRNSPQNQAYFWLVGTDYTGLSDPRKIQRYALVSIYYSTSGENWNDQGGWLSEQDECQWNFAETPCDPSGVVVTLDLAFNRLQGEIPPEVAMLSELTSITLNGDGNDSKITGSLPSELSLLTKIERFSISNNDLTGPIPSGLNWPLATTFDLSKNRLSERIPDDIGRLVSLQSLNLGNNHLSGELTTAIGNLTSLEQLDLHNNTIEGPVPNSIGNLLQLESMDLSFNSLTSLPASMGNLVNMEILNVRRNDLSGLLFDNWASLDRLTTLNLQENELEGPIPASLGDLAAIQTLDLSHNMFSESIPIELGNLATLFHLLLNSNNLSGNIPAALEGLQVVALLRLDDNNLQGAVPAELCETLGENQVPKFYSDCDVLGGVGKIQCPLGTCCTHCCNGGSCECIFQGALNYLC